MTGFAAADVMDLEKMDMFGDRKGSASASCSICLELVLDRGERSVAKLQCGHEFHLDCIGSAFNAKGAMQCPNCRKVEKGQWLYAHGHRSSTDFDLDGWITEDIYDLNYSELPLGYQWCPFSGYAQLASLFEDMESQPNSYHEPLSSSVFGDLSSSSGAAQLCPYPALHGFPHPMHAAPSSSSDHVPENTHFHRHSSSLGAQPSAHEMLNPRSFTSAEPPTHSWQQQPPPLSMPLASNSDHHYGPRLSRTDTNNHPQRLGSFVHPHPLPHGSVPARNGSNLVTGTMQPPPVPGEVRAHGSRSSPFPPIRSSRPRGVTLISYSASADTGGFYGFSTSSSSRSHQDSSRPFERVYGWGRDGFAPLPWIPVDGESRWWGPFNPNQAPQSGSFHQRGGSANERGSQGRSENSYHQRNPLSSRMPPPPPYM